MNNLQHKKLENIAYKVISKMPNQSDGRFGFVITVLMIISISLTLIRIIQECNKNKTETYGQYEKITFFNEQIKLLSLKRSWFTKMTIKKILRKQMSKEDYKVYGYDLMQAILDTAVNLTYDEVQTLMETNNV